MNSSKHNKRYIIILWILFALFCLRVLAQIIQYYSPVDFLPPFNEWHSGTLSYGWLVVFQLIIIFFCLFTCIRISKGDITPKKTLGKRLLFLGSTYASLMILRYIIKMTLYSTERWLGGSIPIFFHIVLASFLITIGLFHIHNSELKSNAKKTNNIIWHTTIVCIILFIPFWILYQLMPSIIAFKLGMRGPEYYVTEFKIIPIKMNDGAILYADLYRPEKLKKAPTILVRIPLDDNLKGKIMSNIIGRIWAERGYNVLIQGVRGRFHSNNKHIPFIYEREDGIATLNWLNRQTWHNKKTGMWGGSYFGYTQWVISDQDSLGLKALFTQISSSSNYKMFYQGGAFAYESALFWATRSYSKIDTPMRFEKLKKGYDFSPMIEADNRVVCDIPFFNEWILHNTFDDYWQKVDGTERNKKITVPNLIMAGWYDPFLNSQIEDFENINKYAPKNIAQASRLIIGPWAHAETIEMPNGYKDDNYRLKSIAPSLKWYDQHLKGIIHNKIPPVEIFVMGINKWRYENSFPLESTNYTNWYLNSNTYNTIDSVPISKSVSKSYYYNPNNPTPSVGGSMLGPRAGPKLQNNLDKRKDILRYDSKVLTNPIEITGKIKLILYVSTNVANTDFIAKLIDVYPDGSAFNISEGVIRKSYKGKDQIEMIEIELNPTSNVFMKGHKIRLEISSSNYPRFSLNYNTGGKNYNEKTGVIAEQKVYTGSITPSKLILPIIPNSLK